MKWILLLFILTGCLDELPDQGSSDFCPGLREEDGSCPVSSSGESSGWDFSKASNYNYDSNFVEISSSSVSLKEIDTNYSGSDFESGTHAGTVFSNNKLEIIEKVDPSQDVRNIFPAKTNSLLSYLKFENSYSNLGIQGGEATVVGAINFTPDAFIGANSIESNSSTFNRITSPSSDVGIGSFTASVWINPKTYRDWGRAVSEGNAGISDWVILEHSNDGEWYFNIRMTNGGSCNTATIPAVLELDEWTHLVGVYNASLSEVSLYKNGVLVSGPYPCSHPIRNVITGMGIGSDLDGISSSNANIDEVAVWDEPFSDTEVLTLYEKQNRNYAELSPTWTPHWNDIASYWKMNGNWKDSSSSGYDLTSRFGTPILSQESKVGSHSAYFDGSSGLEASSVGTELTMQSFTRSAWINLKSYPSPGDHSRIISQQFGTPYWIVAINDLGQLITKDTNAFNVGPTKKLNLNTWYMVTISRDASENKQYYYINGDLELITNISTSPLFSVNHPIFIGGYVASGSGEFEGYIDELVIWKTFLASSEVKNIYNRQKQKYGASYDSQIIDLNQEQALTNLKAKTEIPFMKELVSISENTDDYPLLSGDLSNGLVGYWPFNETALNSAPMGSDFEDKSVNSNHGGEVGGVEPFNKGILDASPYFSNNRITLGDFPQSEGLNLFSIALWIKPQSLNSGHILGKELSMKIDQNGASKQLRFLFGDGSSWTGGYLVSNGEIKFGEWNHVAVVYNGSEVNMFINNIKDTNKLTTSISSGDTATDFTLGQRHTGASPFSGYIDELAFWNRALSESEIEQLYRRGANRVKYQVRTCADASCSSNPEWKGPGGDGTTYFSELYNRSSSDLLNIFSSCDGSGDNLCSEGEFSLEGDTQAKSLKLKFVDSLINNYQNLTARYFQYRVLMEAEDNNACDGEPCLPSVSSISFETQNDYYTNAPSVSSKKGIQISSKIMKVEEEVEGSCTLRYQFSKDGSTYFYLDNGSWVSATDNKGEANSVSEISSELGDFIKSGSLYFRAFLISNGSQSCKLKSIKITQ